MTIHHLPTRRDRCDFCDAIDVVREGETRCLSCLLQISILREELRKAAREANTGKRVQREHEETDQ